MPETIEPSRVLAAQQWAKLRLSGAPPAEASLVADLPTAAMGVLDQGSTSSCVAQAIARGVRLEGQLTDALDYPLPARRWIYRLARETHGDGDVDEGTYISAGLHVPSILGWPSEEHVQWDEGLIDAPMSADDRHHAYDQRDTVQTAQIVTWGDMREEQIRQAVGVGRHPIVFGSMVDSDYLDLDSWAPQNFDGNAVGGHAQLIVGYDSGGVHVLNSWGPYWGVGGLARISWRCARTFIRDLFVIQKVRRPTS